MSRFPDPERALIAKEGQLALERAARPVTSDPERDALNAAFDAYRAKHGPSEAQGWAMARSGWRPRPQPKGRLDLKKHADRLFRPKLRVVE